jgi:hypothetical protein
MDRRGRPAALSADRTAAPAEGGPDHGGVSALAGKLGQASPPNQENGGADWNVAGGVTAAPPSVAPAA